MSKIDISQATRPTRAQRAGMLTARGAEFRPRMLASAHRHIFLRCEVLWPAREAVVNPERTEIHDVDQTTDAIKRLVLEMGAETVGIVKYDPRFLFTDASERAHRFVIVFGLSMAFDCMIDLGPRSQAEVHRVYYRLDDMANRLARQIGAYGYTACAQTSAGDFPLPAYAQLAGLGELGKHGSLISPELGASFRLVAVSTEMPLTPDAQKDFGFDDACASVTSASASVQATPSSPTSRR